MDTTLPHSLVALNVFGWIAAPSVIVAGVWLALRRADLDANAQRATGLAITAALVAWLAVAWSLSVAGFFFVGANDVPTVPFAIVIPIVAGLFLLMRSERVAALIDAVPQSWLVGVQVYRALGVMFLVLWAAGRMPGEFALPAGTGDVIVGLAAPLVAWLNATGSPHAKGATWVWNVFGVADLFVAVGTGFLTSPSPFEMLAFDRPNVLITAYPTVMVPAFLVPLSIILHGLSLWKMGRQTQRHAVLA